MDGPEKDALTLCLLLLVRLPRCPLHLWVALTGRRIGCAHPRTLGTPSVHSLSQTLITKKACHLACPILTLSEWL